MLNSRTLKQLYDSGLSQPQIAKRYNLSTMQVWKLMKKFKIKARPLTEVCPLLIKIDVNLRNKMRKLYKTGSNRDEIAAKLNVTVQAVRKGLKGEFRTRSEYAKLTTIKKTHKLNEHQIQCILGTLLGDGSFVRRTKGNYIGRTLQIVHGWKQKGYIVHKKQIIGAPSVHRTSEINCYKPWSVKYRCHYQNQGALCAIEKIIFRNGKKTVNKQWVGLLTLEGIAYWFMDDGSSVWHKHKHRCERFGEILSSRVRFSTLSFDVHEIKLLIKKLKTYGLKPKINKSSYGKGMIIALNKKDTQHFLRLIKPYVWPIKCMRYKLKII